MEKKFMLCYIVERKGKNAAPTFTARKYAETENEIVEKFHKAKGTINTQYSGFRFYKKDKSGNYKHFIPMDKPEFLSAIK